MTGLAQSRNNWALGVGVTLALIAALMLLFWGAAIQDEWWRSVAREAGVATILATALTLVWSLMGKRMFLAEVLSARMLSGDFDKWKVKTLSMEWDQLDWKQHFEGAREFDIVQAYGYSWGTGSRQALLEEFASKKGNRLRIVLPNPECQWLMRALAERFDSTEDTVATRVRAAAGRYAALRVSAGGTVLIYFRDGEPMYAGYRFDRDVIVTLYSHKLAKLSRIPTIVVAGGEFAEFVKSDFDEMFQSSTEVSEEMLEK